MAPPLVHTRKLPNYLRTYRKRLGLSQDEMAFLLGARSGTKVSRYENFTRQPAIHTIFAYEVLFRTHARDLFAGVFEEAKRTALKRTGRLAKMLAVGKQDSLTTRKLELLATIAAESQDESHPKQ